MVITARNVLCVLGSNPHAGVSALSRRVQSSCPRAGGCVGCWTETSPRLSPKAPCCWEIKLYIYHCSLEGVICELPGGKPNWLCSHSSSSPGASQRWW